MKKKVNIISYMFLTIFLVFGLMISASFLLADSWDQPNTNPPNGGFVRPVNNEGTVLADYISKTLSVNGTFVVGIDDLYVGANSNRVGIATNDPQTELDVNGPIKLGNIAVLPACTANISGSFIFNLTNNMPYVCDGATWQMLQADIDGDGRY